jgi:hypothetical protein
MNISGIEIISIVVGAIAAGAAMVSASVKTIESPETMKAIKASFIVRHRLGLSFIVAGWALWGAVLFIDITPASAAMVLAAFGGVVVASGIALVLMREVVFRLIDRMVVAPRAGDLK